MNRVLIIFFVITIIFPLNCCKSSNKKEISFEKSGTKLYFSNQNNKIIYSLKNGKYSIINCIENDTIIKNGIVLLNNSIATSDIKVHDYYNENFCDSIGKGRKLIVVFSDSGLFIKHHLALYNNHEHVVVGVDIINQDKKRYRINSLSDLYANVCLSGEPNAEHFFLDGNSGKIPTKVCNSDSLFCLNNILITEKHNETLNSFVAGGYNYKEFDRFIQVKKEGDLYFINVYNEDPVGKLLLPGQTYHCKDMAYINFHQSNPILALERYSEIFRKANSINLQHYDFPTVCLWYNDFYGDTSMGNNSYGAVLEMKQAKQSGFSKYSKVAIRLVPDMYALNNQQGWWDDEHWQMKNIFDHRGRKCASGHYRAPYLTTASWAKKVSGLGGIPLTYIQPGMRNDSYAEAFPEHMLFNKAHAPKLDKNGDTMYYSDSHWHEYRQGVMKQHTYDYTDTGFISHLKDVYYHLDTSGIKGLIYDFPDMARAIDGGMDDKLSTTAGAYRKIFELGRQGLGDDAYLHERNIKAGSDITLGVVSSHRIMGDNDKINPTLARRGGLRWYKNRSLVNYDMDAKNLFVTSPDNRDGQRAMLTMTYLTSGRFLMANSFASIKRDSTLFYDFTRIFPFHQKPKSARPMDAFLDKEIPEVYDFVVDSSWHQVTFYNTAIDSGRWPEWGQTFHLPDKGKQIPATIEVSMAGEPGFGALGLNKNKRYHIYDFWNDKYLGIIDGSDTLTQKLRPGEARMMSIHEVSEFSQFLSTNRHIMQGLVDMREKPVWNRNTYTLSGTSMVVEGETYKIVLANNGYVPEYSKTNKSNVDIKIKKLLNDLTIVSITSDKTQLVEWETGFLKK